MGFLVLENASPCHDQHMIRPSHSNCKVLGGRGEGGGGGGGVVTCTMSC